MWTQFITILHGFDALWLFGVLFLRKWRQGRLLCPVTNLSCIKERRTDSPWNRQILLGQVSISYSFRYCDVFFLWEHFLKFFVSGQSDVRSGTSMTTRCEVNEKIFAFNRSFSHLFIYLFSHSQNLIYTTWTKVVYLNYKINDVTAAILVFQNNETAAMSVYPENPLGVELIPHVNAFFCSNKLAWKLATWVKTLYRTIARCRHFTTTTRILHFAVFLCRLRLLFFKAQWNWKI